jgi:hypothetical protein
MNHFFTLKLLIHFISILILFRSRDSVVDITTRLRADNSVFESRQGQGIFVLYKSSWAAPRPTQTSNKMGTVTFFPGENCGDVQLVTHLNEVWTLKMSGCIPVLNLYAFMAYKGTNFNFLCLILWSHLPLKCTNSWFGENECSLQPAPFF